MLVTKVIDNVGLSRFYSRRWEMAWMLFSGVTVMFMLRVNMSVAAPKMRDDLGWTEYEKGLVLSAFYWGYSIGQIPASHLVQQYGGKWIFGLSILCPSLLTFLVPLAAHSSLPLLLFLRALIGFFESATYPAIFYYFPLWVPTEEKTLMIPAIVSGMYIGEIIGFSLSGYLVDSRDNLFTLGHWIIGGWESVFYIFTLIGVLWFPYWILRAYDTPEVHPYITQEELLYIRRGKATATTEDNGKGESDTKIQPLLFPSETIRIEREVGNNDRDSLLSCTEQGSSGSDDDNTTTMMVFRTKEEREDAAKRIPWKAFFTNKVSLTLFVNSWVVGWIALTLLSEMPSYLTDILGFNLQSAGILCVFPYLILFLSTMSFGTIFEYLQRERHWSTDNVRQVSQGIALIGSITGLIVCGFMNDKYIAYAFMIVTQFFIGGFQVGITCAYSDVAPNYSSALNSVGNTIGSIAGIVGPIVVAAFNEAYPGVWGWRLAFFLSGAMGVIAWILWYLYQTSHPVPVLNTPTPIGIKTSERTDDTQSLLVQT